MSPCGTISMYLTGYTYRMGFSSPASIFGTAFLGLSRQMQLEYGAAAVAILILAYLLYRHMRPKRFYFVRHGQTILNAKHIRQGSEGGLTEQGKAQAKRTGEFLSSLPIKRIIASPFERTVETAGLINESFHLPISYTPLLAERRNPSEIIGKTYEDPLVKSIINRIDLSYHQDNEHYSDEENFEDLKNRARACLKHLERSRGTDFIVVTHGIFLKMLLGFMLYRERLHTPEYIKLSFFNPADNGAITVCEYHPWRRWLERTRGWYITSYNVAPPRLAAGAADTTSITELFPKPVGPRKLSQQ